jgi:hypothetical protein
MDADELRRLYEQAGSCTALARWLGKPVPTMRSQLVRAGLVTKRSGYRSPKKVAHAGPDNHNWKGGTYMHSDGYVYELAPTHPDAPKGKGYVLQHRLVVERQIGRYLLPSEVVHHRNENKQDNRPENLEIATRSRHMRHHKDGASRDGLGRFSK